MGEVGGLGGEVDGKDLRFRFLSFVRKEFKDQEGVCVSNCCCFDGDAGGVE